MNISYSVHGRPEPWGRQAIPKDEGEKLGIKIANDGSVSKLSPRIAGAPKSVGRAEKAKALEQERAARLELEPQYMHSAAERAGNRIASNLLSTSIWRIEDSKCIVICQFRW